MLHVKEQFEQYRPRCSEISATGRIESISVMDEGTSIETAPVAEVRYLFVWKFWLNKFLISFNYDFTSE